MKQNPNMKQQSNGSASSMNSNAIILLVIAGLIVLFVVLFCTAHGGKNQPMEEVTIREMASDGLVVHSESGKLGTGEVKLFYSDDLYVEDINGQEIDYGELKASDALRVSVTKESASDSFVVNKIILLPDDSDDYI